MLRESLNAALSDMWLGLMEDPASGVMAGVNHISGQIEGALSKTFAQPVDLKLLPREIPLSEELAPDHEESGEEATPDRR